MSCRESNLLYIFGASARSRLLQIESRAVSINDEFAQRPILPSALSGQKFQSQFVLSQFIYADGGRSKLKIRRRLSTIHFLLNLQSFHNISFFPSHQISDTNERREPIQILRPYCSCPFRYDNTTRKKKREKEKAEEQLCVSHPENGIKFVPRGCSF